MEATACRSISQPKKFEMGFMEEEESKPRLFFLQQVFLWTVVKFH